MQRVEFFVELERAWDTLAYERYEPGSPKERNTAYSNYNRYRVANQTGWDLSPEQTRIIDALAEVVGIPRQRGQPVVMPEYLKNLPQWQSSAEYQARVAAARAKRGK
jgi:hypothetical protein